MKRIDRLPKRRILKPVALVFVVALVAALPSGALGTAPATLHLDSHFNWREPFTPTVTTSFSLTNRRWYVATVSGTFSYYAASDWTNPKQPRPMICGDPLSSSAGPVGMDAQFLIARPWKTADCRRHHMPMTWSVFQTNDGDRYQWTHPRSYVWTSQPTGDHTYSYVLFGRGRPVGFRLVDEYTKDNYGGLAITVRIATASDCGRFRSFGFASMSACTAALS